MRKSLALQIRVSPEEKTALEKLALTKGTTVSALMLERTIPSSNQKFLSRIDELINSSTPTPILAELHDLIACLKSHELEVLPSLPLNKLDSPTANYIAALVEMAAADLGIIPPSWVSDIPPCKTPVFGSELKSLQNYLLANAHICFRRRNLFYDSGLGTRV